ncbi:hypothetical protein RNJ44_00467 [Nakaseomyces bracarensis]|uniref:Uncharacterized protein n=1 Tax=Nakaseomyces bracarensis TaxID=273131 RepID=A0ABR4NSN3_9SACH
MTRVAITLLMACSVLLSVGVIYMGHPMVMHSCELVQRDGIFSGNMTYMDIGQGSGVLRFFELVYRGLIRFIKNNKLCCTIHRKLGPILQNLRILIHYLRPLTQRATSSFNDGFAILKNNFEGVRFYEGNSVLALLNGGAISDDEDEDEEEEEVRKNGKKLARPYSKRSTAEEVMDAVLSDSVDITLQKSSDNVAVFPHIDEVIAIDALLANGGFGLWQHTISRKFSSAQRILRKEVKDALVDHVRRGDLEFNDQLKNIHDEMVEIIDTLSKTIQDINCTMIYDENTDSVFYYDYTGTKLLDSYITRPLITHHFNTAEAKFEELLDFIKVKMQSFVKEAHSSAETVRKESVEAYEEWGDTFFTEWSKYMAFRDIYEDEEDRQRVDGHKEEADEEIEQIYEDWFKFTTHKKEIIDFRNTLQHLELDTKPIDTYVSKLESQLDAIQDLYTDQLSTLRIQADKLFKARDQKEASMFKN